MEDRLHGRADVGGESGSEGHAIAASDAVTQLIEGSGRGDIQDSACANPAAFLAT